MQRLCRCAVLVFVALALASCLERAETITLNPDGSGKAVIDVRIAAPGTLPGVAVPQAQAADMARTFAAGLMKSQGVDAWKDLKVEPLADGRAHVAATAYFPDISKFRLEGASPMTWTKDDKGAFTLKLAREVPANIPAAPPTDAEVAARLQYFKIEYQQDRPTLQMILPRSFHIQLNVVLPGPVVETSLFSKSAENTVALTIDGAKLLDAMDKMMADDKALEESIRNGKNPNQDDDLIAEKLFGKKGPLSATVTGPGKPLFDYQAEMQAARAGQDGMFKKAGIEAPAKPRDMAGK